MGYFKMRNLSPSVSVSIADWMRKHGYAVRPEVSKQERAQLQECFTLMDGDGSGAIDVDELHSAFKMLGLHVTKQAVAELLAKVDADGSGEVELPEFIQIMTMTREAEQEAHFWGDSPRHARGDEAVPLQYLTAAYRRKRVLDNVMDAELRLTYAQPKQSGDANSPGEEFTEPAMDLSATFRSAMQFAAEGGRSDVGTLFRSLAVTHCAADAEKPMYARRSNMERQECRQQIEAAVKARYLQEQADLRLLIDQRQWMLSQDKPVTKVSTRKQATKSVKVRSPDVHVAKNSSSSRATDKADAVGTTSSAQQDDRNAEANAMSLTMLLRRSPDLDVETLGQMNLVSSSSLKGPEEPQANAKQPAEHVVSNDNNTHTDVLDRHHLHSKPAPRPRHAVVPHAIHLTDLAPVPWHDGMHLAETANSDAESEHSKAQPPPLWQSALHAAHGSSPAAVAANGSKGSQQAAVAASGKKKAYVHMCRWYPHINARDAQAAFDLYHPSAKVSVECSKQSSLQREVVSSSNPTPTASTNEQSQAISNADLPAQTAGLGVDEAEVDDMAALHSRSGAASTSQSVAASTGESVVQSTQDSDLQNHDQSCLHLAGASAVQSTDDSAVSAAGAAAAVVAAASAAEVAASDPQGSYSVQEPSLDADPLSPHKNGSVRFQVLLDSITSSEVTNSAAASSEPGVLMSNMPAVAVDDNNPGEQVALGGKGKHFMRTVSSVSASSMKSSLKSVLSNGSSASLRHGSVQLGVNFAETEEDADIKDIEEGKTSIVRGVSDAFPAWLTEGAMAAAQAEEILNIVDTFNAKQLHDMPVKACTSTLSTVKSLQDIKVLHGSGYTKEITAQLACLLFAQRRTRLIAQPTAVKMCARLHAIEQVARS